MGDVSQDVPHKMNRASLPATPEEGLLHSFSQACMGIGDTQPDRLQTPFFKIVEEDPTGLFRSGHHGLTGQYLTTPLCCDPGNNHNYHADDTTVEPHLLI